ncbi:hypothetical protein, partial [Planktothrix mougeotii]|uniref:hypothetical protein n=1 Tax=Planktothrix mougeotii TaxID=54306 RepID=UPI00059562DB
RGVNNFRHLTKRGLKNKVPSLIKGELKNKIPPITKGGLGGVNFPILFLSKEEKELAMIKRPDKQQYIVMLKLYY